MSNRLRTAFLAVITVVWAVNMVVPVFNKHYQPPAELNGVMTLVAGGIVAGYVSNNNRRNGGGGGNSNSNNNGAT